IAQGGKEMFFGEQRCQYDPYTYLLTTVELPVSTRVMQASKELPYLSVRVVLSPAIIRSVLMDVAPGPAPGRSDVKAFAVSPLNAGLLETMVRLVRLVDSPDETQVLLPLIQRELVYRLLVGEQGDRLRQMNVLGGQPHRIAQAVNRIRQEFTQPLRIEDLARQVGMSVSSFHHYFKAVTAMSPLQFQKQLQLQEARRLMMSEDLDAAGAGYRVGYENAAQFSREYKRLFGEPPMRDLERLREALVTSSSS
ncbi:AraC family transcriptional regulator, partial [bacterium]